MEFVLLIIAAIYFYDVITRDEKPTQLIQIGCLIIAPEHITGYAPGFDDDGEPTIVLFLKDRVIEVPTSEPEQKATIELLEKLRKPKKEKPLKDSSDENNL